MKKRIYLLILILSSSLGWSQGLKIVDSQLNINAEVGTSTKTSVNIQNISDHIILLGIKKIYENVRSSQVSTFCINNDCSQKNIASKKIIIKLLPNQVFDGFSAELETGLVPGNSSVKYQFYNVSNPIESVEAEINYSIKEKIKEGILYKSNVLQLSDVFPNPVRDKAIFNYTYINPDKEARIVIHSVLGSVIGEFNLSPYESSITIPVMDYNPGVYFYTLYIDNEGVATKKMVVRK